MNREEFMAKLKALLGDIPADEREEALQYYEDYFDNDEFVKRGEKYWNNSLKALKGEGTKTDNGNVSD